MVKTQIQFSNHSQLPAQSITDSFPKKKKRGGTNKLNNFTKQKRDEMQALILKNNSILQDLDKDQQDENQAMQDVIRNILQKDNNAIPRFQKDMIRKEILHEKV